MFFRHQGNRFAPRDKSHQFHLRVSNSRRKAALIDLPEAVEIPGTIIANEKLHATGLRLHFYRLRQCIQNKTGLTREARCRKPCVSTAGSGSLARLLGDLDQQLNQVLVKQWKVARLAVTYPIAIAYAEFSGPFCASILQVI